VPVPERPGLIISILVVPPLVFLAVAAATRNAWFLLAPFVWQLGCILALLLLRKLHWSMPVEEFDLRVRSQVRHDTFSAVVARVPGLVASCSRCAQHLVAKPVAAAPGVLEFGDRLPALFDAVICGDCGRLECSACKRAGGAVDAPCSWCGGRVSPAWSAGG